VTTDLGELTQHNVKQLKVLNRDIFPVIYNEKFYKDLLEAGPLCKLGNNSNEKSFVAPSVKKSYSRKLIVPLESY
jgi:hypothetical protein